MNARAIAAAVILGCAGVALMAISFFDLADIARRYSQDGAVSEEFLRDIAGRSRVCGAIVIVIAIAVWTAVAPATAFHGETASFRPPSLAAFFIIVIGGIPRTMLLNAPLHWDEAFTFNEFVARPPYDFLSRYSHPNNHVFHTTLAWVASVVSEQKWALRLPAFLAGIAVLAAVYAVARTLRGENTALVATALAAGATPLVEYSAQGRGYTIVTLATLMLFAIPRGRWLLASVVAALGAWAIPIMLFPFIAFLVWLLLQRTPLSHVVRTAATTGALTFLLYLPVLIVSGPRAITDNGNVQSVSFREFARALPQSLASMWDGWMISFPTALEIVLLAAALVALVRALEQRPGMLSPEGLVLAAIAGIAPLLMAMRVLPFTRVWLFLLPLFLVLAASGLVSERWPHAIVGVPAIALAALLSWNALRMTTRAMFFEDPAMADVPEVAAFLRSELPGDASLLAIQPLDAPFAFELRDARLVQKRFDSDPHAVSAALRSRPRIWTVTARDSAIAYKRIRLVHAFPHSELWEIR